MSSTAAALLDAAEGEFAAWGIKEASLRKIMREADADSGAVHYHFGTREALAAAVLDRILAPLNGRRLELLAAARVAAPGGSPIGLPALVDALLRPDIEAAHELETRSRGRARLIGAIYVRPVEFVQARVEEHFWPVALEFLPHLEAALPDVARDTISWRVRWCVFGLLGAMLSDEQAPFAADADSLVQRLVDVCSAALAAPCSRF